MSSTLTRLFTPHEASFEHLEKLSDVLQDAVDQIAQMIGSTAETGTEYNTRLEALDAEASSTHMALLTSLRSTYLTPLPREDIYLLANWLNRAIEAACRIGAVIHSTKLYRLPTHALDSLEILDSLTDLVARCVSLLQDYDQLENSWIQLERQAHRAERMLLNWQLLDATELLARQYYQQKEVARTMEQTVANIREFSVQIGRVLVRES